MPFVPAPNVVELQFRCTFDGEQTMNRVHVHVGGPPTQAICQALATAGLTWWTGNVTAITGATLALREVYCKGVDNLNSFEATASPPAPVPGTQVGDTLPNNCSLAVSLRSGLTGRSARGRWFWQGLTEAQVTASRVIAGTVASIDAAITNLRSAIVTLGHELIIVSYRANGIPRPGGPVYFSVINVIVVDSVIDSQRRRLPGRGR